MNGNLKNTTPWIDNLSVDEKVELANTILGKIVNEVLNAIAFRELYGLANTEVVLGSFDKTREAHAFNFVRDSLYSSLILSLMKIYDQPNENTASLQTMAHILGDKAVGENIYHRIVIEFVGRPLNVHHGPNITQEDAEKIVARERRLDAPEHSSDRVEQFKAAVSEVLKMKGDHQLNALRAYRNEVLGHLAVDAKRSKQAKYGFAEEVLDNTIPIVQDLSLGLQSADQSFDEFVTNWRELAETFWQRSIKE